MELTSEINLINPILINRGFWINKSHWNVSENPKMKWGKWKSEEESDVKLPKKKNQCFFLLWLTEVWWTFYCFQEQPMIAMVGLNHVEWITDRTETKSKSFVFQPVGFNDCHLRFVGLWSTASNKPRCNAKQIRNWRISIEISDCFFQPQVAMTFQRGSSLVIAIHCNFLPNHSTEPFRKFTPISRWQIIRVPDAILKSHFSAFTF